MKATFLISGVRNSLGLATALLGLLMPQVSFSANLPPVITSQPANQTVLAKSPATFQVVVSSLSPLSYQWRKNGVNIAGATSSSFTIANSQTNDQASYSVNVVNAGGTVTSASATLTVINSGIAADPTSRSSTNGNRLTWSHTVGSGNNRLLLVTTAHRDANKTITGVTYGGEALTKIGSESAPGDANNCTIWRLLSPAPGNGAVVVTLSGTVNIVAGATSFSGVNQTTPTGSFDSENDKDNKTKPTEAKVVAAAGDLVISVLSANGDAVSASANPGQATLWNRQTGTSGGSIIGASNIKSGVGDVKLGMTLGVGKPWAFGVVAIKAAPVLDVPTENLENTLLPNQPASLVVSGGGMGLSPAGFSFGLTVPVGATYVVEASPDASAWTPIATNVAATASSVFTDTAAMNFGSRFYRVMVRSNEY